MNDNFDAYRLPLGLTEGVEIQLEGTPAVFTVKLPSTMDEDLSTELMVRLSAKGYTPGEEVNPMLFQQERKKLFFETCILRAEGLPNDMGVKEFFDTYPLAKRALFEAATKLTLKADKEISDALEKLEASLSGKSSGGEKQNNTTKLSPRASNRKRPDQKSVA